MIEEQLLCDFNGVYLCMNHKRCCCSVSKACPTLRNPLDYSTPGSPVLHYLPQFSQTHILPPLTVHVLSQSTLLSLQVALQGNCLKRSLGCMHFPGLSHSDSCSRVLHKGADSVGPTFCICPRSKHLR